MANGWTTQKLLDLRTLTRALAEELRSEVADHLATLLPLVRPRVLLGSYIMGAPKEARGSDKIFKELQSAYDSVSNSKPFNLPRDLKAPIPVDSNALEIVPFEYDHSVKSKRVSKTVRVTSPLKWILAYAGYSPERVKKAIVSGDPGVSIAEVVLHDLVLHVALAQRGIPGLFTALRFPLSTHHDPALGPLPIPVVSAAIPTLRPPDETIIESTEIAGTDAFEEVVDVEAIDRLEDPLRERLRGLVREHRDRSTR